MKTLIITGGIGSGKSLVCSFLVEKGIPVYDADSRTKTLYVENPLIVCDIEKAMGCDLTGSDGKFDRAKLSSIVFKDPSKLSILEDIIHPIVFEDFISWRNRCYEMNPPFVVMESAIFLEKPLFRSLADKVLLVEAPENVRVERVCCRDNCKASDVFLRMNNQHFDKLMVDYIIVNDSDKESLFAKVEGLLDVLWK